MSAHSQKTTETPVGRRVLIVAPVSPPSGGMALQAELLAGLLRQEGLRISFLASNFELPRVFRKLQRAAGIRTILRFVLIWGKVWRALSEVEVVHVLAGSWWYFFAAVWPPVLLGRIRGKRVVLNYRGGDAARFFRRWGWAIQPAFRAATVVTAPSNFIAGLIGKSFQVPVSIVPNILDTAAFRFRPRPGFRPKLLVNRTLERIYGIESVLRAFRLIRTWHSDATLWIAGSGSDEQRLRGLAAEWSLSSAVFLGHVGHDDLPALYDQCDILINGSVIDNFPAALLEASAAGLAIVSTEAGGIPFLYRNEETALLVGIDDWRAMASAVDRVLNNAGMAADLTKRAYAVVQQCSWNKIRPLLYASYGFGIRDPIEEPAAAVR